MEGTQMEKQAANTDIFAPGANEAAAKLIGPVGDIIRAGISTQSSSSCHDHSHDHGGYDHHCEK